MKIIKTNVIPKSESSWTVYDSGELIASGTRECMYMLPEERLTPEGKAVLKGYRETPPRPDTVTFVSHESYNPNVSDR